MDPQTAAAAMSFIPASALFVYAIIALKSKVWAACGTTFALSAMLGLLSYGMYAGVYTAPHKRGVSDRGAVLSGLANYTTAQPVRTQSSYAPASSQED